MKNFNETMIKEMNLSEQEEINGGSVTGVVVGVAVALVIDYWPDIKKAVSDAWEEN